MSWQLVRQITPTALRKEFNWVQNDMRRVRRQRRMITTRFRSEAMKKQAISGLEKSINKLTREEINFKIGKFKREIKKKQLQKYPDTITCNNNICSDCSV